MEQNNAWEPPPGTLRALALELVAHAGGAAVAFHDPISGALLTPAIATALTVAIGEIRANGIRNAGRTLEVACEVCGGDLDGLMERLLASQERCRLLADALDAAAHAHDEATVVALGRSLANAANDGARVMEEGLVVAALRDLQPPHMRLLRIFARTTEYRDAPSTAAEIRALREVRLMSFTKWRALHIDPALSSTWEVLIAALVRHGAVAELPPEIEEDRMRSRYGSKPQQKVRDRAWRITTFGIALLAQVLDAEFTPSSERVGGSEIS